jgi:2-haloacid dehalogenase
LRERWEELQFERLQGAYRSYREVLADSLAQWAGERGYRWNQKDGAALVRSMESWQPFPDTRPALRAAKEAGLRLWIISNTDRSIMEHSLRHLEVEFDGVTVAEDCKAYKPATEPFKHAMRAIHADPGEILHVAFGFKYDIAPARQMGLQTVWVNRSGEEAPGAERPDHVWSDLWPLARLARGQGS